MRNVKEDSTGEWYYRLTGVEGDGAFSGATVTFHMWEYETKAIKINGKSAAFVDDSAAEDHEDFGKVYYNVEPSDTDTPGRYEAEFEVTFGDGDVKRFPNDGYIRIRINDKIE